MVEGKPLPTIWDVPDDLWERIEPVMLELDPPKSKGRNRVDQRKMLEGIIFRLRSGCQWNHLPKELGDDSTIHRTFQRWVGCGALEGMAADRRTLLAVGGLWAKRVFIGRTPWEQEEHPGQRHP